MPFARLDERIRELCRQAVIADDAEAVNVLHELRSAIREHIQHLRKMAVQPMAEEMERKFTI